MKHISKYSVPQREGLYEMLKTSTNKTPHEKKVFSELRDYFAKKYMIENRTEVLILDGYVKEVSKDKFGEDYRSKWTKIKQTGKGHYYFSSYQGKRIYLENYNFINEPYPDKIWRFKINERWYETEGIVWQDAFKNWNNTNGYNFSMHYVQIYDSLIIL